MGKLQQQAMSETLGDTTGTIHQAVRNFLRRYGRMFDITYEEVLSVAYEAWVELYHSYNSHRGVLFNSYLTRYLNYRLLDYAQERINQRRHEIQDEFNLEWAQSEAEAPNLFWEMFYKSLGRDARRVCRLVLNTPSELASVIRRKGNSNDNIRSSVRDYLRTKGWKPIRITYAFMEIQQRLENDE